MSEKIQEDRDPMYSATPYDDAFRTMEGECDDLLIPLVNYFFNESYDSDAVVTRMRNEHFIENPDGSEQKRITDSYFSITSKETIKKYHLECESSGYDQSILIRIFEYTSQIALDDSEKGDQILRVSFPHAGLLLLKEEISAPDSAKIIITTTEGELFYHVPIVKRSDIGLDELFEKRLYFLIPFYILNYRDRIDRLESDEKEREDFIRTYCEIRRRLESDLEERKLTLFSFGVIIESMRRVAFNVTEGHGTVQEKVGEMMGGQIMELDWIKAWRKAEAEGRAEGREEGRAEGRAEGWAEGSTETRTEDIKIFISDKREDNIPDDRIKEKLMKHYNLTGKEADGYLKE